MAIKHTFVSTIADDPDSTLVRPSDWNADHTIENDTITRAQMANYAARGSMTRGGVGGDVEDFAIGATGTYIRSNGTDPLFAALSIVDDTTPKLGGDLDADSKNINNAVIVTPTIASFVNAGHSHLNAVGGGMITEAAISDLRSYLLNMVEDTIPQLGGDLDTVAQDILLKGNLLKTTNLALKEGSASTFFVRDAADTGWRNIAAGLYLIEDRLQFDATSGSIRARDIDDASISFQAHDTGVGLIEVARIEGAAEPAFEMSRGRLTGVLDVSTFDLAFETKAGAAVTGDFTSTTDGIAWILDTTNFRWYYIRAGAVHYIAETAGFQIPIEEVLCPDCREPLHVSERVVGRLNQKLEDGGLHGLWVHEACAA